MDRLLRIVYRQLNERILRSVLTVVGITIGIAALVSLIILSGALKEAVTGQLDAFGADEILVAPLASVGGTSGPAGSGSFTTRDLEVLEGIPQVVEVIPILAGGYSIGYGRESFQLRVTGAIPAEVREILDIDLEAGRLLDESDFRSVVVGFRSAYDTFEKDIVLGSRIFIEGDAYRVVGILKSTGNAQQDRFFIVPLDSLRDTIGDSTATTGARVIIASGADIGIMQDRIERALKRSRGVDDIGVTTPRQIQDQIGGFLSVLDIVVYSIAGISLFVASLGITNSLFTSVLQRTREIGTMKAVGATRRQILLIFLLESAMLGFAGGLIGTAIGVAIGAGFIIVFNSLGIFSLAVTVPLWLIAGSMIFSVVVGILSGVLPALRAANLNPVDALRYE